MKKTCIVLFLLIFVLLSFPAFAEGQKDTPTKATPATKAVSEYPGTDNHQIKTFTTIGEFEKETGWKISQFNEAPMLKDKVASGQLPPLDQRLTKDPLVVWPADGIGEYGGKWREAYPQEAYGLLEDVLREFPLMYTSDMKGIVPNLFKSWEVTDAAQTFVFHLREGIKWDDGRPFTADDFMFWYEDIALNTDLSPSGVNNLKVKGEMGTITKLDDYTLKMSFKHPYGVLLEVLCRWRPMMYAPKHFLKDYHASYVTKTELDAKVKAKGFDTWMDLFGDQMYWYNNPEVPTIFAWKALNREHEPMHRLERNPYYWKVDIAGNQLPYIDGFERLNLSDSEAILLKSLAGDLDAVATWYITGGAANYPIQKKNEESGDFKMVLGTGWDTQVGVIFFNYSHPDPALRELFLNKNFRIALSTAINRQQVNDVLYKGTYNVIQVGPPAGPPYHGEDPIYKRYTEYDPGKANQILDEMGLKWDANKKWRLKKDGTPIQISAAVTDPPAYDHPSMAEMYKQYWAEIGIDLTVRPMPGAFNEFYQSGKHDIAIKHAGWGGNRPIIAGTRGEALPLSETWFINPPWGAWVVSGGAKGEEPPGEYKQVVTRLNQIHHEFVAEPDEQKRTEIEKEMFRIHADNLLVIGSLTVPFDHPASMHYLISNRMYNYPVPVALEMYYNVPSCWAIRQD